MIKLPARKDGQWTVTYNSDKLPDLSATRNLSFDKEGYMRLSKPVISFFSEADDSDFGLPLFYGAISPGLYYVLTDEAQFELDINNTANGGTLNCSQTSATGAPTNTDPYQTRAGACIFDDNVVYATYEDLYTHGLGAFTNSWTDQNVSANLNIETHAMCHNVNNSQLVVTNGNEVLQYSTAYALDATNKLTIPSDYDSRGVAYNNGYLGITCHDTMNSGNGQFYVWDGIGSTANYAYHIGASTCTSPIPYRGSFVFLNGTGQLMYWTPQRLEVLAEFPAYFSNAQMFIADNVNRNESIWVDGDVIYINVDAYLTSATEDQEVYFPKQMGGIWCYDPAIGLYHRHATTSLKATADTIATSSVDTATDEITVTSAPETGTPIRYSDGGGTALAGLVTETIYYAIYVDATTIQLAETLTLAEAGTEIDLTGTGNNAQTLQFYPKSDFGQSYTAGQQGCVHLEERPTQTGQYSNGLFFGTHSAGTTTTEYDAGGFVLRDTENRGYFTTNKFYSQHLQDDWKKLYLKHSKLTSDLDKLVIKCRTMDDGSLVKISSSSDGLITWTDADTFTTTDTQFANVLAGDEVEIIQGTGSGYLAHISSITEDSGTYTVNLDETIKNLTASDTGRVVVHRWKKLTTITTDNPRNDDGYSEIPLGKTSKMIQFKVELRGEDVEIEELLVANEVSKPT